VCVCVYVCVCVDACFIGVILQHLLTKARFVCVCTASRYEEDIHNLEGEGAWRFVFELQESLAKTRTDLEAARKERDDYEEKVAK
jgi:hypothetical protein